MSRFECETAAQCQEIAEATHAAVEPAAMGMLVATVVLAVATVAYLEVRRR